MLIRITLYNYRPYTCSIYFVTLRGAVITSRRGAVFRDAVRAVRYFVTRAVCAVRCFVTPLSDWPLPLFSVQSGCITYVRIIILYDLSNVSWMATKFDSNI